MRRPGPTLVLGGSGFLGSELVRALSEGEPREVIVASRHPGAGAGHDLRREPGFAAVDLEEAGALERMCDRIRPAHVLNLAALARAAQCEREPERARQLNEELPARVASWCAANRARLVHVSTDIVFGARAAPAGGFGEGDPVAPLGVYGATKAAGERALLEVDPAALVVRLPLLFGDSHGRELGASDALLAAVARGERPRLYLDEWRTPLDVGDAAAALVELAQGQERGLLHVAGPERVSRLQLGLLTLLAIGHDPALAQAMVEPARRSEHLGEPPRAEDTSLDASRARALLRTRLRGARAALLDRSA